MEKRNSQLEHGQPMDTCDSGVARCQSQHQYHFWRMSSMFEAHCMDMLAWQLSIKVV